MCLYRMLTRCRWIADRGNVGRNGRRYFGSFLSKKGLANPYYQNSQQTTSECTLYRATITAFIVFFMWFTPIGKITGAMLGDFLQLEFATAGDNSFLAATFTWSAICCGISIVTIEKIGRRSALLISFIGQAITLIPIAILTTKKYWFSISADIALDVFGFIFLGFLGFGSGVMWLYVVEINGQPFRLTGTCIAALVAFGTEIVWIFQDQPMSNVNGWHAIFVGTNLVGALIVCVLCPETTGRSLEYINYSFESRRPWDITQDRTAIQVRMLDSQESDE